MLLGGKAGAGIGGAVRMDVGRDMESAPLDCRWKVKEVDYIDARG